MLLVADLTRLGRSTFDLADIVAVQGQRGISFRSLAEPWLDKTSAHDKLIQKLETCPAAAHGR
ncbi:recombinase family protein [Pseudarthrobacter sp. NamE2]|uniref:recombinase family protein n=1 Tax=Pseudarthrobacter sp. NamE2 TaxID=2576838 RepID=UPI001F10A072|nr:recombinase family protein [Pseudarthrobacter sp. NamE2]